MSRWVLIVAVAAGLCTVLQGGVPPRFSGAPIAQVFTEREIPGSPQTRMIAAHPNGVIYVANVEGLVEYDGITWKMIPGTRGLITHNVAADESGRVWYSGTGHFGWLQADAQGALVAEPLHVKLPLEARNVGHVLRMLTLRGEAYFVTQGARGFIAHASAQGEVRTIDLPMGERAVTLFVHDGAMHVITTKNVHRIDGAALVRSPAMHAFASVDVHSVWPEDAAQASGLQVSKAAGETPALLVVSAAGLRRWRGSEAPLVSDDVSTLLDGDRVSCGAPLGDGTFVLGTERHGVLLVEATSGRVLARYDDDHGLGAVSSTIVAAAPDADGGVWLARFAGVTRIQVKSPMARHDGPGEVRGRVQAFAFHRGQLHVATTQGVFVRDAETGRFRALPQAAGDSWVLLSTEAGLILGGPDLRLIRDDGAVEIIERERLLFRSAVRLRRDPDRIVACTGPGLVRVYRRAGGRWSFEGGLPNVRASLYPIFEDDAGRLWATRNRLEVVRIDWSDGVRLDAKLETLGPAHGLPDPAKDPARVMVFPLEGAAEVSSASGLWRYDEASDRFIPETRIEGRDPARWTRAWPMSDGSLWLANSHESDPGAMARCVGPGAWRFERLSFTGVEAVKPLEVIDDPANHSVWIGHLGLASVDLGWRGERASPPVVRLRTITTTGERLLWGGAGVPTLAPLEPDRNALYFSFAAPSFQPDAYGQTGAQYRARLEGFEREWSPWGDGPRRRYSNLPPGKFTFYVQARDGAAREGPVAAFAFEVLPPWWRTWWFIGIASVSGVGGVAGITRWLAHRALRRRLALLEAQAAVERERLRLARDLHDEVGSGLGRVILFAGEADRAGGDPVKQRAALDRVRIAAQELVLHAREMVWAVSPQHDSLASVVERFADYAEDTLRAAGIACVIEAPTGKLPPVTFGSESRHSLFLAIKEAVHNCVKYSEAKTATLRFEILRGDFVITLRDDGRGFAPGEKRGSGHGVPNIIARLEALHGAATITSAPGQGTVVELRVPMQ